MPPTPQATTAINFYASKAATYDSTWHAPFTQRFISHFSLSPGQHVLDLACGTGLLTFLAAEAVGPEGRVVGVDVSPAMLGIAQWKARQGGVKNVVFLKGDVLDLDALEEVKHEGFDVITVASALVLFPDPLAAVQHWSTFLKPGGVLAVDATHPRNLIGGMVLERVARRMGLQAPYHRAWSRSEASLSGVLEGAGLEVEKVVTVEEQAGYGRRVYGVEEWDDFFVENVILKDVGGTFAGNEVRREAQRMYKEEWEKLAVDGKVEEVDSVFLGVARRPADGSRYVPKVISEGIVFRGGCRCGGVQYTSTERPSDIVVCHCRACQQLSGSAYIPFTRVSRDALTFTEESTRETLKLSEVAERSFCSRCGSPISMAYSFKEDDISLTVSSVDLESMVCELPKVRMHIYLREKAPWLVLGDDGAEQWGTSEEAHLIQSK